MPPKNIFQSLLLSIIILLSLSPPTFAQKHALLIGIGKYPYLPKRAQLEGPMYDIQSLQKRLAALGFSQKNVTVLTDREATRQGIMREINRLQTRTRPGDSIFLYFSGHGTSGRDTNNRHLGIAPYTGALVPYDFKPRTSIRKMVSTLVIGSRDLQPVLKKIEKNRRVFAAFDACYSGYTVRELNLGIFPQNIPRYIDLEALAPASRSMETAEKNILNTGRNIRRKSPPYPYRNVVYLSASAEYEQAVDIPSGSINYYKTVDRKPHGAMTNALLYALSGKGDLNRDGRMTYRELGQYVYTKVKKQFKQSPQLLGPEQRQEKILDEAVFLTATAQKPPVPPVKPPTAPTVTHPTPAVKPPAPTPSPQPPPPPKETLLRIRLEGSAQKHKNILAAIPGVVLTDKKMDLLITDNTIKHMEKWKHKYDLAVYLANGDLLAETTHYQIAETVKRQVEVRELINLTYPNQTFNVFVDIIGSKGVLFKGDEVGFKVKSDTDAHILLINIEPSGFINVIYPYSPDELDEVKYFSMPGIAQVDGKLLGTEYIKVFAFKKQPRGLKNLMGKEFFPQSPLFEQLMQLVTPNRNIAQATIQVKTADRGQLVP